VVKKGVPCCSFEIFHLECYRWFLSLFLGVQVSFPYRKIGKISELYTFILEPFWTKVGLNAAEHACPEAKRWQLQHWPTEQQAVTLPGELSDTFKPQCQDNRTANLMTKWGKKTVKQK
jgi:hypothetical protein